MFETVVAMRGTVYEKGYGLISQLAMRDKKLSAKAKSIYAYLCSFAGSGEDRTAFPGVSLMMDELGFGSKDTFYKFRKELEEAGYITIEREPDERGRFTKCVYHIEAVVIPKVPCPKNKDMDSPRPKNRDTVNRDTENKDTISISSININSINDCMIDSASEDISLESKNLDPIQDEIYEALLKYVPSTCYIENNIPMGESLIFETYSMLVKRFPMQLSPEVVRIACDLYLERACNTTLAGATMRIQVDTPVGFFESCYRDAIKQYKLSRNKRNGSAARANGQASPVKT